MQRSGKVAIIAVAALSFALFASQSYWNRIDGLWNPRTEYDETGGGRTEIWTRGLKVLVISPWGIGIEGFTYSEAGRGVRSQVTGGKWLTAHNSLLQVATELGVAGLIAFMLLVGRTLWELRQIQLGVCERKSTPDFQGDDGNNLTDETVKVRAYNVPRKWLFSRKSRRLLSARSALLDSRLSNEPDMSAQLVRREVTLLAGALEISLWAFVIGGSFLSQAYSPFPYCILAIGVAAIVLARRVGLFPSEERIRSKY
jgi:hypothetical protein